MPAKDTKSTIQSALLAQIEKLIPPNLSLVGELSEILDISNDSAYRRIRCETELSICETEKLCTYYNISFDALVSSSTNLVSFQYSPYERTMESFTRYFVGLDADLSRLVAITAEPKEITYLGDNMPIMQYFASPTLGPFKLYYWTNIMGDKKTGESSFDIGAFTEELLSLSKNIHKNYMKLPSTEVWTDSTIMGVVEQIQFFWNTGMISTRDQALVICKELEDLVKEIEHFAEVGKKFYVEDGVRKEGGDFKFYYSEIEFENTTIHVQVADQATVYLGHLSHRYMKTVNKAYAETIRSWFENIIKKSNLLSASSETIRYRFFRRCQDKIAKLRSNIEG